MESWVECEKSFLESETGGEKKKGIKIADKLYDISCKLKEKDYCLWEALKVIADGFLDFSPDSEIFTLNTKEFENPLQGKSLLAKAYDFCVWIDREKENPFSFEADMSEYRAYVICAACFAFPLNHFLKTYDEKLASFLKHTDIKFQMTCRFFLSSPFNAFETLCFDTDDNGKPVITDTLIGGIEVIEFCPAILDWNNPELRIEDFSAENKLDCLAFEVIRQSARKE